MTDIILNFLRIKEGSGSRVVICRGSYRYFDFCLIRREPNVCEVPVQQLFSVVSATSGQQRQETGPDKGP